ncbi:hypothetical protein [Bradyrhizobium sp. BR 10289]|uniref:hypothetical protein n=1 Tax=Bradyrhizobium sp. BR 10289 TaxID=2749993 RepID=UPI001C647546|nr:hypothetical protein [Bradyrhizobium sp. BR 10289]MBW7975074.1 hypothetical protein [Bradyrhizobium sp. BR 10289]
MKSTRSAIEKFDAMFSEGAELPDDQLSDFLSSALSGINWARHHSVESYSGIFWALTRLVGCYERLSVLYEGYAATKADELCYDAELEIEHLLVRLRVLIDELAYVIRVCMPPAIRGLSQPKGPGPLQYRQFSIRELLKFVRKHPDVSTALTKLLENNRQDIERFVSRRDDIVHFRAKAIIFRTNTMRVGFLDSRLSTSNGAIEHTDLREFIEPALVWVWRFMQSDLVQYFREEIAVGSLEFDSVGIGPHKISMPGSVRLKKLLNTKCRSDERSDVQD